MFYKYIKKSEFNLFNIILRNLKLFGLIFLLIFILLFFKSIGFYIRNLKNSSNIVIYIGELEHTFQKLIRDKSTLSPTQHDYYINIEYYNLINTSVKDEQFISLLLEKIKSDTEIYNSLGNDLKTYIKNNIYVRNLNNNYFEIGFTHKDKAKANYVMEQVSELVLKFDFIKNMYFQKNQYLENIKNKLDESLNQYAENIYALQKFFIENRENIDYNLTEYKNLIKNYIEKQNRIADIKNNIVLLNEMYIKLERYPLSVLMLDYMKEIFQLSENNKSLNQKLLELISLEKKLDNHLEENEKVNEIGVQINVLRKEIKEELIQTIKTKILSLIIENELIEDEIKDIDNKISKLPYKQIEFMKLKKIVELSEKHYTALVNEYVRSHMGFTSQLPINLIQPSKPTGLWNYTLRRELTTTLIWSFILGAVISFIFDLLNNKIKYYTEIENYLNTNKVKSIFINKNKENITGLTGILNWFNTLKKTEKVLFIDTTDTFNLKDNLLNEHNISNIESYVFNNQNKMIPLDEYSKICLLLEANKTKYSYVEEILNILEVAERKLDLAVLYFFN